MNQAAIRPIARGSRPAAAAAAAGFIGLAGFELALTLGAPLGRAAMGGTHTQLPAGLRIVTGFATLFWPVAALVVLRRGGYRVPLISWRVSRAGTWVLVGLLSLSVLLNLASSSDWERFLQAPIAAVLAALCLAAVVAGPRAEVDEPSVSHGWSSAVAGALVAPVAPQGQDREAHGVGQQAQPVPDRGGLALAGTGDQGPGAGLMHSIRPSCPAGIRRPGGRAVGHPGRAAHRRPASPPP
jgi:hypothetical protein